LHLMILPLLVPIVLIPTLKPVAEAPMTPIESDQAPVADVPVTPVEPDRGPEVEETPAESAGPSPG
jgi:hypothetical protein